MASAAHLREQAVQFSVCRQAQGLGSRRRKPGDRKRLAQTHQPQTQRQCGSMAFEGAVHLALQQTARDGTAGVTLGHNTAQPALRGQVIHRQWASQCRGCGQLCTNQRRRTQPGGRSRHSGRHRQMVHSEVSTARPGSCTKQTLEIGFVYKASGHQSPETLCFQGRGQAAKLRRPAACGPWRGAH